MTEAEILRAIKQVKGIAPRHCDLCGQQYAETDFKAVKAPNGQTMVHLNCQNCGNSYILNIYNPASGTYASTRAPLNLDMQEPAELMKFAGGKAVSTDEALDAYNLLLKTDSLEQFLSDLD